jgi:hypothetical protein
MAEGEAVRGRTSASATATVPLLSGKLVLFAVSVVTPSGKLPSSA